ncbi:unnamed protein product [Caenorhabditis brenneri]
MKLIIFLIFNFFVIAVKPEKKEDSAKGCENIPKKFEELNEYCSDHSQTILEYYEFFKNFTVGHRETMEKDTHLISHTCRKYKQCPPTNSFVCFLPQIFQEKNYVCHRVRFLRSSFGKCLQQFPTQTSHSKSLGEFVQGVDKEGLRKKCNLLKPIGFETLKQDVERDCGSTARKSLEELYQDLNNFYNCTRKHHHNHRRLL